MNLIRIMIVSDTHGSWDKLRAAVERQFPFDFLVHCGDGIRDILHAGIPRGVVVIKVPGNMDMGYAGGMERLLFHTISGKKIMITHGDLFRAHNGLELLESEGIRADCDVVFFGHTHNRYFGGSRPVLFNPGALSGGSYGIAELNGSLVLKHFYL
ncbi:MAG: YfcE family phosphodiesterase [Spirochaetes bacterium]|jgi:hypothetical protein|nr:YfcE family phosphodiesterase [Spirochaetota bacterium]